MISKTLAVHSSCLEMISSTLKAKRQTKRVAKMMAFINKNQCKIKSQVPTI